MPERTVVRRVENAILYDTGDILVKGVRFSYPHAITPQKGMIDKETGKLSPDSFSLVGLLPKATHREAMQLIKGEIDKILAEKKVTVAAHMKFLRNGDDSGKKDYLGCYTISVREKLGRPPSVRDVDGTTHLKASDEGKNGGTKLYGGCWGNILLRPWYQPGYGKRVNANFIACQIVPPKGRDASQLGETDRISEDEINDMMEDESDAADWEGEGAEIDTQGL